jgi:hypothetical protein
MDAWFLRHRLEHTGEFEFKSLIYVFRKGAVTVVLAGSTMSAPQPPLLPRSGRPQPRPRRRRWKQGASVKGAVLRV